MTTRREIRIPALARVEGEGALTLTLDGERVVEAKLRLFEPPRLFEALLRGRACSEAPDITARICGICPVAYQMSACQAIEQALGVTPGAGVRALRRLLYCGEWIESHILHVLMLHAPDFLGLADALQIAQAHPERVQAGLHVKQVGNAIVRVLGGREVHPINVRVGGFYKLPEPQALAALVPELTRALGETEELFEWLRGLAFPDLERDYELVALQHPHEYPMNEGRLVSNKGLSCSADAWNEHIVEEQVPHSTALHARLRTRGAYQVGPLARFVHNFERLHPRARSAAERAGLGPACRNPFRLLLIRTIEVLHAIEDALQLIAAYEPPPQPAVSLPLRAGVGHGLTEAPRGVLYHRYVLDDTGHILDAQLVPPTAQNQRSIELDLEAAGAMLDALPLEAAIKRAEQVVRNYDPCISCSTHLIRLTSGGA